MMEMIGPVSIFQSMPLAWQKFPPWQAEFPH
jgi:hypothetical protein